MNPVLDSLPPKHPSRILCSYVNTTSLLQIARISNIPNWYFERVIFPGQRLLFEALPEARLEIYTARIPSVISCDQIACVCLQVSAHVRNRVALQDAYDDL